MPKKRSKNKLFCFIKIVKNEPKKKENINEYNSSSVYIQLIPRWENRILRETFMTS